MITDYLSKHSDHGKLYNSYIITTDDTALALNDLKNFLSKLLKIENIAYSHDILITQKEDSTVKNISIDKIREMSNFLHKTSMISGKKIAIIFGAENMNLNASNACLKILEDTPANSYLFLITNNLAAILPTIRSRCSKINHHYSHESHNVYSKDSEALYLRILMRDTPLAEKLAFIKNFSSKNRDSWLDFSLFTENLISKFCKKASTLNIPLSENEISIFNNFRSRNLIYLQNKYHDICKINRDVIMLDLELQSSTILLLAKFKY